MVSCWADGLSTSAESSVLLRSVLDPPTYNPVPINDIATVQGNAHSAVIDRGNIAVATAQGEDGSHATALTDGEDYILWTEGDATAGIDGGTAVAAAGSNVVTSTPGRQPITYQALPSNVGSRRQSGAYYSSSNTMTTTRSNGQFTQSYGSAPPPQYQPYNMAIARSTRAELASNTGYSTNNLFVGTSGNANATVMTQGATASSGLYSSSARNSQV
jgi:hypothetical protein